MASLSPAHSQSTIQDVVDDFTEETLRLLMPVMIAVTWLWAASMEFIDEQRIVEAYGVLALLLVNTGIAYWLYRDRLTWGIRTYLFGLLLTIGTLTFLFPEPTAFSLYMLLVLIAVMFADPPAFIGIVIGSVALILLQVHLLSGSMGDAALPILLIGLVAFIAWISSRRLFLAVSWSIDMSRKAQESAEEARQHRAELHRVMQTLTNAHILLEKTNRALIFAQEAAEKAYNFKSEFVANVSHELRTPLNLIVGFSEMIVTAPESYGGVTLPREYRGDIMAIYRSAQHLLDLINDVLDLSQIEAGQLPVVKEPAVLQDVICESADIVRGLADARSLQLKLDLPEKELSLELDRTRIRQVLLNLLTNAMRFTDEGSVTIRATVVAQEVEVAVEDTGRGIDPENLARAFEAFNQLDDQEAYGGSGLGLAVSKRFVELHGGRMWIESELGRGTKVAFTLPLQQRDENLQRSRPRRHRSMYAHDRASPTILVVHDDPRVLDVLRRHLAEFDFVLAQDASTATTLAAEELPRAVLLGCEQAEIWREMCAHHAWLGTIPVITSPLPALQAFSRTMGAADYLPKPVSRSDLEQSLARLPCAPEKILIVDDNPHVVRLLARMLRAIHPELTVLEAFGGREGLAIVQQQRPDVVLLDLMMPEVSGYQFLDELKKNREITDTQVILVSVRSVEQETAPLHGSLSLRRDEGFSLTELLALLNNLLSVLTQPAATSPTSAAAILESQFG